MFNYGFPCEWSTIKKLIWLQRFSSAASFVWEILTGTAPLALLDAIAHPIHSLTQYGLCVQDGTPTPSAPVDIVCNNGVLRYGALGRNLLDPSAANTILGYYIRKEDGVEKDAPSNFMFAGYMPVEPGKTYVAYGRAKTGNDLADYNRVAWYDSTKTWIEGASYTQNRVSVVTAPANAAYARFSCNPSGNTAVVVTQELVDSYNWMFAEGTAEITPFIPFVGGIYTDGEDEVLTVRGKNLFNKSTADANRIYGYFPASGRTWSYAGSAFSIRIPCKPNTAYTARYNGSSTQAVLGFGSTANDDVPDGDHRTVTVTQGVRQSSPTINTPITITTGANDKWLIVAYNASEPQHTDMQDNLQVEQGSTPTDYEPYHAQTVNDIPMLLGVGGYKDEAEIIQGIKTGRVGIKVFDGTETIAKITNASAPLGYYFSVDYVGDTHIAGGPYKRVPAFCTHFVDVTNIAANLADGAFTVGSQTNRFYMATSAASTKDELTALLAAQYAAGTPVIVVYPLATETTEQTTPHALHTSAGTNVVDVAAAVEGVTLAIEYAKESA